MDQLVRGVNRFRAEVFEPQREMFRRLAQGQQPQALFITCADSRINPNLLTQTEPGELFILRNAGNIIPPYRAASDGEGATIEYAVAVLGVPHVIVCGHTRCGAMAALMDPEAVSGLPAVRAWFAHAEATRRILQAKYAGGCGDATGRAAAMENVLVQLDHLRTHPAVAVGLARGKLSLYGWVWDIESGEVFGYQPDEGRFVPLGDRAPQPLPSRALAPPPA